MSPLTTLGTGERYRAFLVRLSRPDVETPWQIVARDVETGEEFPMTSPEGLLDFLRQQMPPPAPVSS